MNLLSSNDVEVQLLTPLQDLQDDLVTCSEFSVESDFARVLTALQADQNPRMRTIMKWVYSTEQSDVVAIGIDYSTVTS